MYLGIDLWKPPGGDFLPIPAKRVDSRSRVLAPRSDARRWKYTDWPVWRKEWGGASPNGGSAAANRPLHVALGFGLVKRLHLADQQQNGGAGEVGVVLDVFADLIAGANRHEDIGQN